MIIFERTSFSPSQWCCVVFKSSHRSCLLFFLIFLILVYEHLLKDCLKGLGKTCVMSDSQFDSGAATEEKTFSHPDLRGLASFIWHGCGFICVSIWPSHYSNSKVSFFFFFYHNCPASTRLLAAKWKQLFIHREVSGLAFRTRSPWNESSQHVLRRRL